MGVSPSTVRGADFAATIDTTDPCWTGWCRRTGAFGTGGSEAWVPIPAQQGYPQWVKDCNTGSYDPQTPLVCLESSDDFDTRLSRGVFVDKKTGNATVLPHGQTPADYDTGRYVDWGAGIPGGTTSLYNNTLFYYDYATNKRIDKVCPGQANQVWHLFYQNYTSPDGKKAIDDYFAKNPDATPGKTCEAALHNNYTDDSQRRYGRMNAPDWETRIAGLYGYVNPDWLNDNVDSTFMKKTIQETDFNGRYWGNPLWNRLQRSQALAQACGTDGVTGLNFMDLWAQKYVNAGLLNEGRAAEDYFNPQERAGKESSIEDPLYSGNLPYLAKYLNKGAEPWHESTIDPSSYDFVNPCNNRPFIEQFLPIAAGVVGGAVCFFFVPGHVAKLVGGTTGAATAYLFMSGLYGFDAVVAVANGLTDMKQTAATVLAVGGPATVWMAGHEMQFYPPELQTPAAFYYGAVAAGALGFLALRPLLQDVATSSNVITWLSSPIAVLEKGFTNLFNGCYRHTIVGSIGDTCFCEVANTKPLLVNAIAGPILGTTGAQQQLRKKCLANAMTTGAWGTDTKHLGTCNADGHMDNKEACITAGAWAYSDFLSTNKPNPRAAQMQAEIKHCMDAANPSMLPPKPTDAPCAQYGTYFRMDPATGKCKDFTAPLGQQGVGERIVAPSSCTIL